METPIDSRLLREAKHFHLVFRCDDCAHFAAENSRCAHGYPTEPHRKTLPEKDSNDVILFCKEFDSGP